MKKLLTILLVGCLFCSMSLSVFAAETSQTFKDQTSGQMSTDLTGDVDEWFTVTVPASIDCTPLTVEGKVYSTIHAVGDIAGEHELVIEPIAEYTELVHSDGSTSEGCFVDLIDEGGIKTHVPVDIDLDRTRFNYGDLCNSGVAIEVELTRYSKLSAGKWSANVKWKISLE